MAKESAGLLMFRISNALPEFFLVHPGGPFFRNKDEGSWTIPKGEPLPGEELLQAAIREFFEETGIQPEPPFFELGAVRQKGGKTVYAWAFSTTGSGQPEIRSNVFQLEWPPRSGKFIDFPEIDKGGIFPMEEALRKIIPAQIPFLHRLVSLLNNNKQMSR